jgi:hypothetical protein
VASDWSVHLPWVHIGLRVVAKEPSDKSLPSFSTAPSRSCLRRLSPLPIPFHQRSSSLTRSPLLVDGIAPRVLQHHCAATNITREQLPDGFLHVSFVMVSQDAAKSALAPLYDVPYAVLLSGLSIFSMHLRVGDWAEVISTQRLKPASGLSRFMASTPPRRGYPLSTPPPARSPHWQYPGRGQGTPCLFCSGARHHFCSPFRPSSALWQPPARFSFSSPAPRLGGTSGCSKDSKYHLCVFQFPCDSGFSK